MTGSEAEEKDFMCASELTVSSLLLLFLPMLVSFAVSLISRGHHRLQPPHVGPCSRQDHLLPRSGCRAGVRNVRSGG